MAYLRKLQSGRWQATVRLPDGRRKTYSARLKSEAAEWARATEEKIRTGGWREVGAQRLTVGQWLDRWLAARVVATETERSDRSSMPRIKAAFGSTPLAVVTRLDVQAWVRRMERDGVGRAAIARAYNVLRTAYSGAVMDGYVTATPCRWVTLPKTPERQPPWFRPEEVGALLGELPEPHRTMTALMCFSGLRWGEAAGLRVADVDHARGVVSVVGAMSQLGKWQEYPKTSKSRREVPVPGWVLDDMKALAGDGLVFTTRRGKPLMGANWRTYYWYPAVTRAKVQRLTPHACRHTAASWLVQAGVPLYEVSLLLGHTSLKTTQRYSHLAPDRHDRVTAGWPVLAAQDKPRELTA